MGLPSAPPQSGAFVMSDYSIRPNAAVPIEIIYSDQDLLVVYKPAGVVTQPGKGHDRDSLLNGLFASHGGRLQNLGASRDWGLLHRLDKETSGLVLVALQRQAFDHLLRQFKDRQVRKLYWALVAGRPNPAQGVVQKPIAEVAGARKRAVLRRDGEQAITAYRVLESAEGVSLIEARPKTGKLHQIRVHMASLECPVLGDDMYGEAACRIRVPRLCLHAAALSFIHPTSGHRMEMQSPVPADFRRMLKRLGMRNPDTVTSPGGEESASS